MNDRWGLDARTRCEGSKREYEYIVKYRTLTSHTATLGRGIT